MSRLQTSHSEMAIFGPFLTFIIGRLRLTSRGRQNATISRFSQHLQAFACAGSLELTQAHQLADSPTENPIVWQVAIDASFSAFLSGRKPQGFPDVPARNYENDRIGLVLIS